MRPLLWALNAVDLCDKCDIKSIVHTGVRFGRLAWGFAALVCVYAGRTKPENRELASRLSWACVEAFDRSFTHKTTGLKKGGLDLLHPERD